MTNDRAIEILRWINGQTDGLDEGVNLREISIALDLAAKALALDRVAEAVT